MIGNCMRSFKLAALFIAVSNLTWLVEGHGQLTKPVPRPDINGIYESSGQREPVCFAYICTFLLFY